MNRFWKNLSIALSDGSALDGSVAVARTLDP